MHPTPTAAEFKARHPRFAGVADGLAESVLTEATRSVGADWELGDYRDATMHLAAHLLMEEGAATDGVSPVVAGVANTTGAVQKIKADTVEVTFENAAERFSGDEGATFGSTPYGRRFLAIQRRYGVGAVLVV